MENYRTNRISLCGVGIDNISFENVMRNVENAIKHRTSLFIVTPNTDHIVKLQQDIAFNEIYRNASLVLADGMPLLWAARFLGTPLKEKISGSDLLPRLCKLSSEKGYRLFFLGGRPGSGAKAADMLKKKYPKLQIVGIYSPPFGFEKDEGENKKVIAMVKEAKPDILFVGLGAPKQEKWIYLHKGECQVSVSIGIGAGFDFVSGLVKRAPRWMQKAGLEWFWRLIMEPKRLWKRYLIDDMVFFWLVFKQKISDEKR